MDIKELQAMGEKELQEFLEEKMTERQVLQFQVAGQQLKDVRSVRENKKLMAQIFTVQQQRIIKKAV